LQKNQIVFHPIGYVRTKASKDEIKSNKKNVISKLVLNREFMTALDGIDEFSHLFIIFYLHKIKGKIDLKVNPMGKVDLPLIGLFSTRTAHRPNPIGLTLVRLLKREKNNLFVAGLDAFDRTPILDIKPFDPIDTITEFKIPGWLNRILNNKYEQPSNILNSFNFES